MSKIRVLVIDDAVVIRKLISDTLSSDPAIEVIGTAATGAIGLAKIQQLAPDLITLDVEMPEMDGIATLKAIRALDGSIPVIMFSTLTERGADKTIEALSAGANDYVAKPANVGSIMETVEALRRDLLPKVKMLGRLRLISKGKVPLSSDTMRVPTSGKPLQWKNSNFQITHPSRPTRKIRAIGIGISTGGPNALVTLFSGLKQQLPVPIFIVQHMPPVFTKTLADRLKTLGPTPVFEAVEGQPVIQGQAYIAPGGFHMECRLRQDSSMYLHLTEDPPENSCRPAADVLFRSLATIFSNSLLALVMTGMGSDGMEGCRLIKERGGYVVIQDEPSSVVWGMPGSVASAGLADACYPLNDLAGVVTRLVNT